MNVDALLCLVLPTLIVLAYLVMRPMKPPED